MPTKEELRELFRQKLDDTIGRVNSALAGVDVASLEPVLNRVGHGQQLPHW
jgi:hypothetical protein